MTQSPCKSTPQIHQQAIVLCAEVYTTMKLFKNLLSCFPQKIATYRVKIEAMLTLSKCMISQIKNYTFLERTSFQSNLKLAMQKLEASDCIKIQLTSLTKAYFWSKVPTLLVETQMALLRNWTKMLVLKLLEPLPPMFFF